LNFHAINRQALIAAAVFVFLFLFSGVFFFVSKGNKSDRTMFFPELHTGIKMAETHTVTGRPNREADIREFTEELLLGPKDIKLTALVPHGTKLRSLVAEKDTVYVNISQDILREDKEVQVTFPDSLKYLEENIRFNFRDVGRVVVTIEGQQPVIKTSKSESGK
jgi:spore germination protein GerM